MDTNNLECLVKRYFDNSITEEEQEQLAALIQKAKNNVPLKNLLEKTWETYQPGRQMPDDMSSRILNSILQEANQETLTTPVIPFDNPDADTPVKQGNSKWKYIGIAASVVLIISVAWLLRPPSQPAPTASTHIVSTQKGSRLKAKLPDGTTIWLNAGSHLEYDNEFGTSVRKVSLSGEAFFDVAHDKEKPFIIHTAALDLKVLGTTFNVRAYPEEQSTEAALITGVLEVSLADEPSKKLVLQPNEKISVTNQKITTDSIQHTTITTKEIPAISTVTYHPGDSSVIETSWVKNKLVFRNKPFEEVTAEMSRWYNVNFEVRDKNLMKKRFTGTFETETIYEALTRLSDSYNFWFMYDKERNVFIIDK